MQNIKTQDALDSFAYPTKSKTTKLINIFYALKFRNKFFIVVVVELFLRNGSYIKYDRNLLPHVSLSEHIFTAQMRPSNYQVYCYWTLEKTCDVLKLK